MAHNLWEYNYGSDSTYGTYPIYVGQGLILCEILCVSTLQVLVLLRIFTLQSMQIKKNSMPQQPPQYYKQKLLLTNT